MIRDMHIWGGGGICTFVMLLVQSFYTLIDRGMLWISLGHTDYVQPT